MRHSLIMAAAAVASAATLGLAGLAFAGSALALPFSSLQQTTQLSIKVTDEGTYIKEGEYPDLVAPGSQQDSGPAEAPQYAAPSSSGDGDSSAGEIPEIQRAFPSQDWPPSMRHD
jgi:hypothetical protein